MHLGSWRWNTLDGNRPLTYLELADELSAYVERHGLHPRRAAAGDGAPVRGSWGYQVTGYSRRRPFGSPDDLRVFVERLHERGLGVIVDWVPAHFPRDEFALARFDGTALYEHDDPRRGAHPDWGTLVFNFGRHEVRNFLISNALFWLREYHVDGIRVDAVASMLYLDYSRERRRVDPNEFGGREDLDAVAFLKELNELVHAREPGVISAAEESTAWPGVSRPTYLGGLGFGFKWNMGWMHDTLGYFQQDPIYRRYHHHELTFSLMYAFSENFILPLSHDEVVHGKGSLYAKMAGDHWQKLANLRALYGVHVGTPRQEAAVHGLRVRPAARVERRALARLAPARAPRPRRRPDRSCATSTTCTGTNRRCGSVDSEPTGFWWLEGGDAENNVIAFVRASRESERVLVCVCNLSPVPRPGYRVGLPRPGRWREALNTDSASYGGSDVGNGGSVQAEPVEWHGQRVLRGGDAAAPRYALVGARMTELIVAA